MNIQPVLSGSRKRNDPYWAGLGDEAVGEFEYARFEGGPEFDDDTAWLFVAKHL